MLSAWLRAAVAQPPADPPCLSAGGSGAAAGSAPCCSRAALAPRFAPCAEAARAAAPCPFLGAVRACAVPWCYHGGGPL
jgi:hypothetical protein